MRSRDVSVVSLAGTSLVGVLDINVSVDGDTFDYSADSNTEILRTDLTKLKVSGTINCIDQHFNRDIADPAFGEVDLNEVLKISCSEKCEVIADSSEGDYWITYIGTTKTVVTAEVEMRDLEQAMKTIAIGTIGDLTFGIVPAAEATAFGNPVATETITIANAALVGCSTNPKHGDLNTATLTFRAAKGESAALVIDGGTDYEIHPGDSGTCVFTAPKATAAGSNKTVTISNVVVTGRDLIATHGARTEHKFTFEAYSSDGITSPIAVA